MIRCPDCRAERLPTNLALVATTLSPSSPVKAMANDGPSVAFSRWRAMLVWTAETLHGSWTLSTLRADGRKLSFKLYHESESQAGYQQLITEAPIIPPHFGGKTRQERSGKMISRIKGQAQKGSRKKTQTSSMRRSAEQFAETTWAVCDRSSGMLFPSL